MTATGRAVRHAGVRATAAVVLALCMSASTGLASQKTDVVVLENDDHITGEIKELYRGKLSYSTDYEGTISIEWNHIASITSRSFFEVETSTGDLYFGRFESAAEPGSMVVAVAEFSDTLRIVSVVRIVPIESSFWQRLKGRFDLGFTYQQANRNAQLTLSGKLTHRARKIEHTISFSSYFQNQRDTEGTSRNSLSYRYGRQIRNKLHLVGNGGLEQNQELGLDLRISAGGGASVDHVRTNRAIVASVIGLNYINEKFSSSESRKNNVEGVLGGEAAYFLFDSPKTDIDATLAIFPNLTDLGRVRLSLDARLSREVWSDFYIGLTVFDEFDSRPPAEGASKNDFGTTLSIGYSF